MWRGTATARTKVLTQSWELEEKCPECFLFLFSDVLLVLLLGRNLIRSQRARGGQMMPPIWIEKDGG